MIYKVYELRKSWERKYSRLFQCAIREIVWRDITELGKMSFGRISDLRVRFGTLNTHSAIENMGRRSEITHSKPRL
jgi:hypothetical protein